MIINQGSQTSSALSQMSIDGQHYITPVPQYIRTKHYIINMAPIPWARARLGKTGRFINKQKLEQFSFGLLVKSQHNNEPLFARPINIDITFFMKQPEGWSQTKKDSFNVHGSPPDTDNLIKFVLDALTDICYSNDCIVFSINAKKLYDRNPRTEFIISELL